MLESVGLRYDPVEDRLVLRLRLRAGDGEPAAEHQLLLTRRVCTAWRADMQAMVDLSAPASQRLDPAARAAVSAAHHAAVASSARVRREPPAPPPAGALPRLVRRVACGRRKRDGRWVLRFEPVDGPTLGLVLSDATLHALFDLLGRRVRAAGWGLPALPGERLDPRKPAPGVLH